MKHKGILLYGDQGIQLAPLTKYMCKQLKMKHVGVGNAWLDCSTFQSMNDASNFVRIAEERTRTKIDDIASLKSI